MRGLIDPPCQTIISSSFTGRSVRWDARSDRVPPLPSSQARLLAPSPLRTVRNTFALHGSSTQQRPLNERGRSLIQVQLRPTRYWLTADSHGDGKLPRRVGSRTNGLRRRRVLCFLHRFHKWSRVRAPKKIQVWLVVNGGQIEFLTPGNSYKVKRARRNPRVTCYVGARTVPRFLALPKS